MDILPDPEDIEARTSIGLSVTGSILNKSHHQHYRHHQTHHLPQLQHTSSSSGSPVGSSSGSPPIRLGRTAELREQNNSNSSSSNCSNLCEQTNMRNNEVRSVMLYGIPIVALVMDNQERLCLAQISNTLLKSFSYNEIHNRRVALGITCVQCTPVQLELLRRAGAMPVSSRRCGMITKREAERLCKSFLQETSPPKLPDTFSFDVYHHCAWGCRGAFNPSRYNSSRAKCIKCVYCGLFFSPNKFIFHSHRLPESKYVQPDAANFNSWRRHIKLSGTPPDDISFAWEDVKAMFNGGSRKRAMAASLNSVSKQQQQRQQSANQAEARNSLAAATAAGNPASHYTSSTPGGGHKKPRLSSSAPHDAGTVPADTARVGSDSPKTASSATHPVTSSHALQPPYPFPLAPMTNKSLYPAGSGHTATISNGSFGGPNSVASHGLHQRGLFPLKGAPVTSAVPQDFRQSFAEFMWSGKQPTPQLPYSCLLWPRPPTGVPGLLSWPGLVGGPAPDGSKGGVTSSSARHKMTGSPHFFDPTIPENLMFAAAAAAAQQSHLHSSKDFCEKSSPPHPSLLWDRDMLEKTSAFYHQNGTNQNSSHNETTASHASAFKPVSRKLASITSSTSPSFQSSGTGDDTNHHRVTSSSRSPVRSESSQSSGRSDEVDVIGEEEVVSDESVKREKEGNERSLSHDSMKINSTDSHPEKRRSSASSSSRSLSSHESSASPPKNSETTCDSRVPTTTPGISLNFNRGTGGLDLSYATKSSRQQQLVMRW